MLFASDLQWWEAYKRQVAKGLWPTFRGERWSISRAAWSRYGLNWINGEQRPGLSKTDGLIHLGGNSGYGALGLAHQFGVSRIILLGYDMQRTRGMSHWHGNHPAGLGNGNNFKGWVKRFQVLARDLAREGIEVTNATRTTALDCFERTPLEIALNSEILYGEGS